ncbi:O-antigen ligase family protein [Brevundimonas faecalis]|uniref:O-antigen ligase family protein n=1 Tax=Brevundimonas faecalis TaxID=947378 RepID=UPI00361E0623
MNMRGAMEAGTTASTSAARQPSRTPTVPLADAVALAASVALILIYSDFWGSPLTGYGEKSADFLRNFYYPAYPLALMLVCMRPGQAVKAVLKSPFLIGLLVLTAATYFWSIAPDLTLRRIPALIFTTLAGVALAARWSWRSLAEILAGSLGALAVLALLLGLLLPDMGRMQELFPGAWRGPWLEKNSLGNIMVQTTACLIAAGVMSPERRKLWLALACISIALVVLSTSKTALVVLILSLGSIGFVAMVKSGPMRAVISTWLAVFGVVAVGVFMVTQTDLFFELLGKDATLTGRTNIWAGIMHQMADHPWRGFGYGAVWDDPALSGPKAWVSFQANFTPANAHSGWLELYISLGLGGVILFALWLLQAWIQGLWAAYVSPGGWLALPLLTSYSVTLLTESVAMNWHELRWVIIIAVSLKLALGDKVRVNPALRTARQAPGPAVPSGRRDRR